MKRTGRVGYSCSAAPAIHDAAINALKTSQQYPLRAKALLMRSVLFIWNSSAGQFCRPEMPDQNARPRYYTGFIVLPDSWERQPERQAMDRTMEETPSKPFRLFHESWLQLHRDDTFDFAIDAVFAFHGEDAFGLGILDHGHGVTIAPHIADGSAHHPFCSNGIRCPIFCSLMRRFRTDI
jgi:hypothetical protein